jgi:hypothetical protein
LSREIELEHWADEGEPTEEEVLHSAVIDELKCFEVYPKLGSLLPGQTLTLTLAYHYTSMVSCSRRSVALVAPQTLLCAPAKRFGGVHRLPLLLRISQGKQFWLVFEGRTIDVATPFLFPLAGK